MRLVAARLKARLCTAFRCSSSVRRGIARSAALAASATSTSTSAPASAAAAAFLGPASTKADSIRRAASQPFEGRHRSAAAASGAAPWKRPSAARTW
jgi:hypothetical protein